MLAGVCRTSLGDVVTAVPRAKSSGTGDETLHARCTLQSVLSVVLRLRSRSGLPESVPFTAVSALVLCRAKSPILGLHGYNPSVVAVWFTSIQRPYMVYLSLDPDEVDLTGILRYLYLPVVWALANSSVGMWQWMT